MKYTVALDIDKPRQLVAEQLASPAAAEQWMEGLIDQHPLSGEPGTTGSTRQLRFQMGKRELTMIETTMRNDLPERLDLFYESKVMKNWNFNALEELGPSTTRWTQQTEFQAAGVLRLFMWLMPGSFKKQTRKHMAAFKAYAEAL